MANNAKDIFQHYVKQGMTDREALFKLLSHYMEMSNKNEQHLRGEIEQLKLRIATLEGK